jgi:hypothetical protein
VSHDEQRIAWLVASATARAKMLLSVEAFGWAAAAAAIALEVAQLAGLPVAGRAAAMAAAAVTSLTMVVVPRRSEIARRAIVRALERGAPVSRNLILTADEIAQGALTPSPATRARVFADAAAVAARVEARAALPARPAAVAVSIAAVAWAAVAASALWHTGMTAIVPAIARSSAPGAGPGAGALHVTIVVRPPKYTALPDATFIDPAQVQAIEGSELAIAVAAPSGAVTVEHDGATRSLDRSAGGTLSDSIRVTRTGYLLVASGSTQRTIPIVVVADALPAVRLTSPGRDLVYSGGDPRIAFAAHATDDHGLQSLALRYTKVSGSGENFEFKDGEIPLALTRSNPRDWSGRASRSLSELGLKEGDMLVYRAVAADARPGDGTGTSDTFFVEISKLGVAAGDAFTLPEEETRYALSQQMLIVKTERLHQRRASMAADAVNEEALNLAVEQRMIRAEFVFMLGGEIQDEDVEAEQSSELQEGRLQNRGQRDLRAATVAMSQAEKSLTGANTADALDAERIAVAALQRAFARDRYILRALATRDQLDPNRRLTGSLAGVGDWRRTLSPAPENRRAAVLQDLVRGLADLARDPTAQPPRAAVLAAEAIRIDSTSPSLREVAAALQHMESLRGDSAAAAGAVSAAVAAALSESRRAHADPALDGTAPAPALAGAFDDALRVHR